MSDHSFIPKANPKIVPPAIPAPRKESLEQENARLKAEVERLKEGNECLDQMHEKEMARSAFLCEQVERLTKAGDKMAHMHRFFGFPSYTLEWEAAKEGKQP